jgi:ethanolamine transporter EutH
MGELVAFARDIVIQLGGLVVWPVARRLDLGATRRLRALQVVFVLHVMLWTAVTLACFLWVLFRQPILASTARHALAYLGLASYAASFLVVVATRRR